MKLFSFFSSNKNIPINVAKITLSFAFISAATQANEISSTLNSLQDRYTSKLLLSDERERVIPNKFIVVLKDTASSAGGYSTYSQEQQVESLSTNMSLMTNGEISKRYTGSLQGFSITVPDDNIEYILNHPDVDYVEEDRIVYLQETQFNPTWGLDRIDEATRPLDNQYNFSVDGRGVNVYVVDTGADLDHPQFGGRMTAVFDAIGDGRNGNDCNGHGTHVAGTVGSNAWGVAKAANLFAVRVFACGRTTSLSAIVDGMNWVVNNARLPAVANMSLGGGTSTTQDRLIKDMFDRGIVPVVAAGNSNANTCGGSPARAPEAITVASSTSSDRRSSFSNWGSCVDLFAPGSSITSTWLNGSSNTISGTSMASPHVAGVAALILQNNPNATAAQVSNAIISRATTGQISDLRGSPNRLLYMGFLNDNTPPVTPTPTPPPTVSCAFKDNFTTSTGWFNSGSSTCSTGTYVRANPTSAGDGGVTTQVGGDSGGDGFAAFTARNTSAGSDDVDGGVCTAQSPTIAVAQNSILSIDWFHGQRDTGDDQFGDYYELEYSLDGGNNYLSLVSIGDVRTQAQWKTATAEIPAGSSVIIRVSTSDGASEGDLIEGGVDEVSICTPQ